MDDSVVRVPSQAAFVRSWESKVDEPKPLMLRSESLNFIFKLWASRLQVQILFFVILSLAILPAASAQADFTLQAAPFSPTAINPGGTSTSNVTIGALNGFNAAVALSCQIAPQQTTDTPTCEVSPSSVSPPAGASVTITSTGLSVPGLYTVTITGSSSSTHSVQQNVTVVAVTPLFTVTVGTAVAPSTVHAGSGGQGAVQINPINGYSGTVTLSCSSITPLVTIPPICTFDPPVVTVAGVPVSSTIAITTIGPITKTGLTRARSVYAFWLSLPVFGFALLGAAIGGKRSRGLLSLLALFALGGCLLLTPACGNDTSSSNVNPNGITPKNSYTFTLVGVDANGVSSSNTGTTTAAPTVTLTVN